MSKGCGCCAERRQDRKEFRQCHGGGPEELPHRGKRPKNKGARKTDHKHIWETNGWEKQHHAKYVAGVGYVRDPDRFYLVRNYECLECGKRGKREYNWSPK